MNRSSPQSPQRSKALDKTGRQGHCGEKYKARTGTMFKRTAKFDCKRSKEFRAEKGLEVKMDLGVAVRS